MRIKTIGIYSIHNKINDKRYIGCSVDILYRYAAHMNSLKHNLHYNNNLQADYNEYMKECFELEILEVCTKKELREKETQYIAKYNTLNSEFGYNLKFGGRRTVEIISKPLSMSQKKKISLAMKGKQLTPQCYEAIKGCKKPPMTEEHKRKIIESKILNKTKQLQQDFVDVISKNIRLKNEN